MSRLGGPGDLVVIGPDPKVRFLAKNKVVLSGW